MSDDEILTLLRVERCPFCHYDHTAGPLCKHAGEAAVLMRAALTAAMAVQPGWIKCSERMPEAHEDAIVWTAYGADIASQVPWIDCNGNAVRRYWQDTNGDEITDAFVTHWQPLPGGPSDAE